MPPTVIVKSAGALVKSQREAGAQRVITQFGDRIPDRKLLCFFDDEDWKTFKDWFGIANRGFCRPLSVGPLPGWPPYLWKHIFLQTSRTSQPAQPAFDFVTYLYGSTCSDEVGMTMTFAHELQHFIQHSNGIRTWAANTLVSRLDKKTLSAAGLRPYDIPHELEARIASKRIAENLFGSQRVTQYIDSKIAGAATHDDAADWKCIRELTTSEPFDLAHETKLFFPRLKDHQRELERILQNLQSRDPTFSGVDLDALLRGAD